MGTGPPPTQACGDSGWGGGSLELGQRVHRAQSLSWTDESCNRAGEGEGQDREGGRQEDRVQRSLENLIGGRGRDEASHPTCENVNKRLPERSGHSGCAAPPCFLWA